MACFENEEDFSRFFHSVFSKNDRYHVLKPKENSYTFFRYEIFTISLLFFICHDSFGFDEALRLRRTL
jgi:hypothetical protein